MDTLLFPFAYFRVEIYAKNSDIATLFYVLRILCPFAWNRNRKFRIFGFWSLIEIELHRMELR